MIILMCWASAMAVSAQDSQSTTATSTTTTTTTTTNPKIHTLFGEGTGKCKVPVGLFIEMNGGYSMFGSKSVFLPGMSMGVILNHHWTIGITGNTIGDRNGLHFNNIYYDSTAKTMKGANLSGSYGGLLLEYTLFPNSRVHLAFPLMIGGGSMYFSHSTHNRDSSFSFNSHHEFHPEYISKDRFFVIEPGVRVECNVIKSIRIGLGISYRYSPDFKLQNTSPDLINQFTAKLSLRFGKF